MGEQLQAIPAASGSRTPRQRFREALDALQAECLAFAVRFINDATVRARYIEAVRAVAADMTFRAESGHMSWDDAANEANRQRNLIMEAARYRTSDVGRARAQKMKAQGLTLEALIERHAREMFGKPPAALSPAERERVMRRILQGVARARPGVSRDIARLGRLGRGLFWLSIGIALYDVATAEDPAQQAVEEGAVLGAGFAGSVAGGAVAGLVCGPGAPICVTVGVVVGGAFFAFGISLALD